MTEREEIVDQLVATVRRFAREQLIPAEQDVEETDDIPERIIRQIKELGLFGMTIPESYDGLGLSLFEEIRVVSELTYASPVFRSYFGTSNGVGTLGITIDGTQEQRRPNLPPLPTGHLLSPFCLSTPPTHLSPASPS